jgi:hypothetical protein
MNDNEKDQLIDAQKQVIGILFEVIKRLQANNDLDENIFKFCQMEQKMINGLLRFKMKETRMQKLLADY